jgi:D-alanine-D-alanine ligase-like ATP-grasp enzyme
MRVDMTYGLSRRGGAAGRRLAVALDLLSATGPRYMWQRWRDERALARLAPGWIVLPRIWREAAAELDVEVHDRGDGSLDLGSGEQTVRVWLHVTPLDDEATLRRARDKARSQRLLLEAGVPVPGQITFDFADFEPARRAVAAGGSWVVKPAEGVSGGQGATTGVREEADLRRATVRAARNGRSQVLEQQAAGDEYRLLLLDGKPLGALRRFAPTVTGDGRSTVAELVHEENRRRLAARGNAGLKCVTLDLDALLALEHAGLGPGSVPAAGEEVAVKGSRSQAGARETETVPLAALSAELVSEAAIGARALGLRLAGIDLVTPDIGRSLAAADGVVLEVNGTPGLHYHYLVREPDRADRVAVPVLERLLETSLDRVR